MEGQLLHTLAAVGGFQNGEVLLQHFPEQLAVQGGVVHHEDLLLAALRVLHGGAFRHHGVLRPLGAVHEVIRPLHRAGDRLLLGDNAADTGGGVLLLPAGKDADGVELPLDLTELLVELALGDLGHQQQKLIAAVAHQ